MRQIRVCIQSVYDRTGHAAKWHGSMKMEDRMMVVEMVLSETVK